MKGTLLTWTRIERPPAGFLPGRVVALVEAEGQRRYALWEGAAEPRVGAEVRLTDRGGTWVASA